MNRTQIFTLTVVVAVAASFVVVWFIRVGQFPRTSVKEVEKASDFTMDDTVLQYFKDARYITIEKVVRTCRDYEDGSFDATYDTYLVSDMDLEKKKDNTQEYAASLATEEGLDDEKVEMVSFIDQFGFSYDNKNAWEIFEALANTNGIDQDLSDVDFEEDTYELTKQKLYTLRGNCSILDEMLEGINSEDVVNRCVYYQTIETEDKKEVPEGITAYVQYKDGSSYVTKTMYLELIVNHWTDGEV